MNSTWFPHDFDVILTSCHLHINYEDAVTLSMLSSVDSCDNQTHSDVGMINDLEEINLMLTLKR